MGKKKIDKLRLIDNKLQRNVAFCKRKRGFLKKAIELSCLCDQQILIIIYDKERHRLVQFSSEDDFQIEAAYKAIKVAKQPENKANYEKFTNEDYQRLEMLDFRSVRYKKKHMFDEEAEVLSEFEELEAKSSQHSMIDLSEKIEPNNNSNDRKCQKTQENEDIIDTRQTRAKNQKTNGQPQIETKVEISVTQKESVVSNTPEQENNQLSKQLSEAIEQSKKSDPAFEKKIEAELDPQKHIEMLQFKVLQIITQGKQFDPWPPQLIEEIEKLQLKLLKVKEDNGQEKVSQQNEEEKKKNLIASFLQDLLAKQIQDKDKLGIQPEGLASQQANQQQFQPAQEAPRSYVNMPYQPSAEELLRRQVIQMVQKNPRQQQQQLAQLLLQQTQQQFRSTLFAGGTTMGGNNETPMFQSMDNKLSASIDASKSMEFVGWNNNTTSQNNLNLYKNNNSHVFKTFNQGLFSNLKQQIAHKQQSPNLGKLAHARDRATSIAESYNYQPQQYQQINFMNQILNQGQNKNAFDTDSQISNLSMINRSNANLNIQQQLQQKLFNKSPQTYGMGGVDELKKNDSLLTPRGRGVTLLKQQQDCDGMSDFLGQQEHFTNQFDNKNRNTKPKDEFYE